MESTAKIIDNTGIPKALNETQSSVVKFRQAISLAKAIDTNINIQSLVNDFHPLGEILIPEDIILFKGLYPSLVGRITILVRPKFNWNFMNSSGD